MNIDIDLILEEYKDEKKRISVLKGVWNRMKL